MGLPGPEIGLQATGPVLLAVTIRGTALIGLAFAVAFLLRRSAGTARHILWSVTIAGLLVLPLLSGLLPVLPVPLPAVLSPEPPRVSAPVPAGRELTNAAVAEAGLPTPSVGAQIGSVADAALSHVSTVRVSTVAALVAVWLVGAAAVAAALILGLARVWRTMKAATPVQDPAWCAELEGVRRQLRIRRRVRLLSAIGIGTPLTGGIFRPVVLLPEQAHTWNAVRRRLVLQHELVHVRRLDVLRQLLTRLALCAYWFHPLVWVASRMATLAREQACDEEVIALGNLPSVYARHLLELSAGSRPPAGALAMIERPHLEKRLMAILELRRRGTSTLVGAATGTGMVIAALSVAAAQPQETPPAPAPVLPPLSASAPLPLVPPAPINVMLPQAALAPAPIHVPLPGAAPRQAAANAPLPQLPTLNAPLPSLLAPPAASAEIAAPLPTVVVPRLGDLAPIAPLPVLPPPISQAPGGRHSCQPENMRGNFSGTVSTWDDGDGTTFVERFGYDSSDRVIQKYVDDLRLCMRVHGAVDLAADGGRIGPVGDGGWVVIESELDGVLKRLEITPSASGSLPSWSINGQERTFDQSGQDWRDQILAVLADYWEMSQIRGQASSLRGQISSIRGQRSSLRGQISSARGQVSSLRGKISSARGHVSSMRGRISSTKGQVSSMRGRISSTRGRLSSMRGHISSHRGRISSLNTASRATGDEETQQLLAEQVREAEEAILEIENEIVDYDVDAKVAEIERQIEDFGMESRVAEIEREIESYNVDAKVDEIEEQIKAFDLESRVAEIEQQLEARLEPKLRLLQPLVR